MVVNTLKTRTETAPATAGDVCEIFYVDEPKVRMVAEQMPSETVVSQAVEVFKVLSDPTRVKIVDALSRAELCVCDLATLVGLSISAVSHQLRLLRALQLVQFRKVGRLAYYSLADDHTARLLRDALKHVQDSRARVNEDAAPDVAAEVAQERVSSST